MKKIEKILPYGEEEEVFPFGIETDEDMSKYHCLKCAFEEDVPGFMIDEFIEDDFLNSGLSIEKFEVKMPVLICPKCGGEFTYKETDE